VGLGRPSFKLSPRIAEIDAHSMSWPQPFLQADESEFQLKATPKAYQMIRNAVLYRGLCRKELAE